MNNEDEQWEWVPGYEGRYKVSTTGRVFAIRGPRRKGGIMKLTPNVAGYFTVGLWKNKKPKGFLVSRLVGITFVPGFAPGLTINHINFDRSDNRRSNLEWVSQKENLAHSRKAGRAYVFPIMAGEQHPRSKLTDQQVLEIRELRSKGLVQQRIADRYGITQAHVSNLCRGHLRGNL